MNIKGMGTPKKIEADKLKIFPCLTFEETFKQKYMLEVYNRKALKYILTNWEEYEGKCIEYDNDANSSNYNPKEVLTQYMESSKGCNTVKVVYKKSVNSKKYGRWFANGSLSIANMPRKVRHTICKGLWIDIDFNNCHPVILEHLCVSYDINCPFLTKYNNNREEMLKEVMTAENCSRDIAKRCILKCLNGNKKMVPLPWWNDMQNEFNYIAQMISNKPEYKKLRELVVKYKDYNIDASVMNLVLCYFENKCLEVLYNLFVEEKIICKNICSLIFDGMQVEDNKFNRDKLTQSFLDDISKAICEKTGFYLGLSIKEFDEGLELPVDYDTIDDTFLIESGDDKTASEYFIKMHKNLIKKCDGRTFLFNKGIWTEHPKEINDTLVNLLSSLDIRVIGKESSAVYSRNKTRVKNCIDFILADDSYNDAGFIDKLFNSNLHYLAFNNGIWSFKNKKLYEYKDLPEVCFTKKVNRDFDVSKTYIVDGEKKDIKYFEELVYEKILNPIFPSEVQRGHFLKCASRALAGHYEDKKWYCMQGMRNCGKGVLTTLLENCFESYVGIFKADNFLCNRLRAGGGDEAKKLSWMIPLSMCRLAISNEMTENDDEMSKDVKLNGILIKSFASGGDTQQARQNYQDEKSFKMQPTMFILCNNLPKLDPPDTAESLENFVFKSKFIDPEDMKVIEELKDDTIKMFKWKDNDIKNMLKHDGIITAFTKILFENYLETRAKMPEVMNDDNQIGKGLEKTECYEIMLTKMFQKTNDDCDVVSTSSIIDYMKKYSPKSERISEKKLHLVMSALELGKYGTYRIDGVRKRGYKNIKLRDTAKDIIDENDNEDD